MGRPMGESSEVKRISVYDILDQSEKAIEDYDKAIEIDPQYAEAYYNRGSAYDILGQSEQARQDYAKAEALR